MDAHNPQNLTILQTRKSGNGGLPSVILPVSQCSRPNLLCESTWLLSHLNLDCRNGSIFLVSHHWSYFEISQATTVKIEVWEQITGALIIIL